MTYIRCKVRAQNDVVLTAMDELGIKTQRELAELVGVHAHTINALINFRKVPRGVLHKVAQFIDIDIFTLYEQYGLLYDDAVKNTLEFNMSRDVYQGLTQRGSCSLLQPRLDRDAFNNLIKEAVTEREYDILKEYFGLEGFQSRVKNIGDRYGLSSHTVSKIKDKALLKLRDLCEEDSKFAEYLKDYYENI